MKAIHLDLHVATKEKLKKLYKQAVKDDEANVANRLNAILLNAEGKTTSQVAELFKVTRQSVSLWLKNYEAFGVEGLLDGYRPGRPSLMTQAMKDSLYDIVESGPVAYGIDSGVWTSPLITDVILEEFGIPFHPGHVRKILGDLGLSVQRPKRVFANADVKKQNRWIRYTYPDIKKKPKIKK